ncbi:MAG TPA: hypothetical protein VN087_03150 [Verrucomicrobiae bacterium]|nr:hypothetical protein [Verrucomicrobiae bacterium]
MRFRARETLISARNDRGLQAAAIVERGGNGLQATKNDNRLLELIDVL